MVEFFTVSILKNIDKVTQKEYNLIVVNKWKGVFLNENNP